MAALRAPAAIDDYRKPDKRTASADMRDELTAAGMDMEALGRQLEFAVIAERDDLSLHVAARLSVLGRGYRERAR